MYLTRAFLLAAWSEEEELTNSPPDGVPKMELPLVTYTHRFATLTFTKYKKYNFKNWNFAILIYTQFCRHKQDMQLLYFFS